MTDAAVLASINLGRYDTKREVYECGCQQRGERWHLCSYHNGYSDGYDAALESKP